MRVACARKKYTILRAVFGNRNHIKPFLSVVGFGNPYLKTPTGRLCVRVPQPQGATDAIDAPA